MKIYFEYPFVVVQKCDCLMQNVLDNVELDAKGDEIEMITKVKCSLCGKEDTHCHNISENAIDLSNEYNAYKLIPSIKDEMTLVKLDTFNAKVKDGKLYLFGKYTNLRFFDNIVEDVTIPVKYRIRAF